LDWIGHLVTSFLQILVPPTPPPKDLVSRARSQSNNRRFEIFYSLSFLFQSLLLLRFSSSISVHYFFFFFFFKKKNIHLLSSKSSIYLVAFATHIWPFIFGLFTYRLSHPFDSFFNYLNKICRRQRTRVLVISPFACLEAHYFFQPNRHQAMSKLRPKSFETSIKKMDIPVLDE